MKKYSGVRSSILLGVTCAALLFLAVFPTYRQYSFTPAGTVFPLVHGRYSDYYGYISYIRQGAQHFSQTDQYTTGETNPKWTHTLYTIVGKAGSVIGADPFLVYHVTLVACLLLFLLFCLLLIRSTVRGAWQVLAVGFLFFAGPVPPLFGVSLFGKPLQVDSLWWTKMDIYDRLTLIPHHFFGTAMLVAATYTVFRFHRTKQWRWCIACALFNGIGIFTYPVPGGIFTLALGCMLVALFVRSLFFKKNNGRILAGLFLITLVAGASLAGMQHIYAQSATPWLQPMQWEYETHKNEVFPAEFSVYILSFGILLPFLPFALIRLFKRGRFTDAFLWCMFILPLLLYQLSIHGVLPVNKLRFVSSAPYVFAGLLAVGGAETIAGFMKKAALRRIFLVCLVFVLAGDIWLNLANYWWPHVLPPRNEYRNIYIPVSTLQAISFIDRTAPRYTGILTNGVTGAFVPAFSSLKVYVGHELDTPDFWQHWKTADTFFQGKMTKEEAKKLLKQNNISYVIRDYGFVKSPYDIVEEVASFDTVAVYRVR